MKNNIQRAEARDLALLEAAAAQRFAAKAENLAAEGRFGTACDRLDVARMAARCAMQQHDLLWDAAGGVLTDDEAIAFEAAEVAATTVRRAAQNLIAARR